MTPSQFYFTPQEAAASIKDGDVLLFEGRRLFSWGIKLATRSRYSHVAIAAHVDFVDDQPPILCVLEALEGVGVRMYPFCRYMLNCENEQCPVHWFTINETWAPKIDRQAVVRYAVKMQGFPYAPWWQFAIGASWIWKQIRKLRGEPLTAPGEWFHCSRLVMQALQDAGYDGEEVETVPPGMVSPGWVSELRCLRQVGQIGHWRVAR